MAKGCSVTKSAQSGLTLIELMAVIMIAGVLLAIAVPGMESLTSRSRQLNAVGDITAMLARARSEAATLYQPVTLCSSSDGLSCSGSLGWEEGWVMFVDKNSNKELDEGETIIQVGQALPSGTSLSALYFQGYDEVVAITFQKGGMPETAGTFRYCVNKGAVLQAVNVGVSGQARIAIDANGDGKLENNSGAAIPVCL